MIIDHASGRRRVGDDDAVGGSLGDAPHFRVVVIEAQVSARHIGQVGGDVARSNGDFAVLHVFGVDEGDIIDEAKLGEKNRTNQAIEVAAGHQSECSSVRHECLLCGGAPKRGCVERVCKRNIARGWRGYMAAWRMLALKIQPRISISASLAGSPRAGILACGRASEF